MSDLQQKIRAVLLRSIFLSVALGCATMLPRPTAAAAANREIYDDVLASDWQDWSWDTTTDASTTTPVHSGGSASA